ncbi:hypothetical protein TSOC_011905 [Tetrabaena socialis]|uniref:Uncharacterized protein n=1 Tax=Tetrabaena socialis TaxID=47790 RepID=A0A2J7ZPF9_9CHLO|nr:hypothetical protein TSOC_011905 [Tetrabaena socialis]|eukprot:PNH02141.1 hypothetical protein TSOC_011905 [Tetrabaena socialis]
MGLAILSFLGNVALVMFMSYFNLQENYSLDHGPEAIEAIDKVETSDVLKYFIIIARLPIPYPSPITRMAATLHAATGAESVAFSYSCLFPKHDSAGQARSQLLGALLTPCVVVAISLGIWASRYYFCLNRAVLRRSRKLRASSITGHADSLVSYAGGSAPNDPPSSNDQLTQLGHAVTLKRNTTVIMADNIVSTESSSPVFQTAHMQGKVIRSAGRVLLQKLKQGSIARTLQQLDKTQALSEQLGIVLMIAVFIL